MSNMTTVWAHLMDQQQVQPMGYVDDLNVVAKGAGATERSQAAADETKRWTDVTKQRLSPAKSWLWATNAALRQYLQDQLRLCGEKLKVQEAGRILGAFVHFTRRKTIGVHHTRLATAYKRMKRIAAAPLSAAARRRLPPRVAARREGGRRCAEARRADGRTR